MKGVRKATCGAIENMAAQWQSSISGEIGGGVWRKRKTSA